MSRTGLAAAAALVAFAAAPAFAAPITTAPAAIVANGQSYAVFAFADAANQDQLRITTSSAVIFDNKANTAGNVSNLGVLSGNQVFTLTNVTTGITYTTNTTDSGAGGDGFYHANVNATYSTFNVGAVPAAVTTALGTLPAGDTVLYVGFEDVRLGDYDYNDLIFAFVTPGPTRVPEPASLMLVGAGLVGLGVARRKRLF